MAAMASVAVKFDLARGIFEGAQREAQATMAQLDPYLFAGDAAWAYSRPLFSST
jgi:hypothetical protein